MSGSMFSTEWYRVADLRPKLRQHVELHRQRFRGLVWYILQDRQGGRYHRLSPAGHLMLCLMDGRRSMQTIWEMLGSRLGHEQPTQDECIALLTQLHMSDLVVCNVTPDLAELEARSRKLRIRRLLSRTRNPLAVQIPFVDPDRFLSSTFWLVRWMFSGFGFVVWLAVVGLGAALAGMNWSRLTGDLHDLALSGQNILLAVLVFPFVKALHELGHGYAVKKWGGDVHEMGIMLLVLMPVPYVDASASLTFQSKWQRALVGAAGIMVELLLAALAMIVWVNVQQGWVSAIMFNVMLIGGLSTLFFNGNPLLRFDGYYVLSDLIEIPNLATRANKYVLRLVQRYLLGLPDDGSIAASTGEKIWLFLYAIASFIYRIFIMLAISLLVASKYFFFGVVLTLWSLAHTLLLPLVRGLRFLVSDSRLRRGRSRSVITVGSVATAIAAVIFLLPLPYATVAEGIVWAPESTQIRTQAEGEIVHLLAPSNVQVRSGTPLIKMDNFELRSRLSMLSARRLELENELEAKLVNDRVQVQMVRALINHIDSAIALAREEVEGLVVRAAVDGQFVLPHADDLVGRFAQKGQQLGMLAQPANHTVRVVLSQDDVDLVRYRTRNIHVRLASDLERLIEASLVASTPAAITRLPSAALSTYGGGRILAHPDDKTGLTPLETVFAFDLRMHEGETAPPGVRAFVRFDHGYEPIGWRWVRAARQVFLAVFHV
jgi:putative peptide zinc metalloprotease protein